MYNISVLTSSRADYSIYKPLLIKIRESNTLNLQLIVFGTHTSGDFGYTVNAIIHDGFEIHRSLPFVLDGNSPESISISMSRTMEQFAHVWNETKPDLIICLGDRYEMFAAVAASVPFALPVAHIHGGETTLGAMDNKFRHALTHMSEMHFASSEEYRRKIISMVGSERWVFNTGALSIDNLQSLELLSIKSFKERFGVDLSRPTILTTFHPETVSFGRNEEYASELSSALKNLSQYYQVIITMPNADTMGSIIRKELVNLVGSRPGTIYGFENLGTIGYLSAMKHCTMLVGNTSSGFIEASYFPKWVVNLGNRQDGRIETANIRTIPVKQKIIVDTVNELGVKPVPNVDHPYGNGNAAKKIVDHIISYMSESNYQTKLSQ